MGAHALRRAAAAVLAAAASVAAKESASVGTQTMHSFASSSVVKIFVTGAGRSYLLPWQVQQQREWSGSGFAVTGRLLMTNAHVVADGHFIEVTKQDSMERYEAEVACIGHDVDLALLRVASPAFWKDLEPVALATELPELYSEVTAVGFPVGGSTVSVTKGVVSRIDAQLYVHPASRGIQEGATHNPGHVLIIQIDAAINSGNSGGPTLTQSGSVCGVSSSGITDAQSIGYIIPAQVARLFLDEYLSTDGWGGLSDMGIAVKHLESAALRRYLMPPELAAGGDGVLVSSVSPLSPLYRLTAPGDIILKLDGKAVSKEGTVPFPVGGSTVQLAFRSLTTTKPKGSLTQLTLLRKQSVPGRPGAEGRVETVSTVLGPLPSLMRRYDRVDASPSYFVSGGLVFTVLSTPLLLEYSVESDSTQVDVPSWVWQEGLYRWVDDPEAATNSRSPGEVVVLLRGLRHRVNAGYDFTKVRRLRSVNGREVRSLRDVARLVCDVIAASEPFLVFSMAPRRDEVTVNAEFADVVLDTSAAVTADAEIQHMHQIGALSSDDLRSADCRRPRTEREDGVASLDKALESSGRDKAATSAEQPKSNRAWAPGAVVRLQGDTAWKWEEIALASGERGELVDLDDSDPDEARCLVRDPRGDEVWYPASALELVPGSANRETAARARAAPSPAPSPPAPSPPASPSSTPAPPPRPQQPPQQQQPEPAPRPQDPTPGPPAPPTPSRAPLSQAPAPPSPAPPAASASQQQQRPADIDLTAPPLPGSPPQGAGGQPNAAPVKEVPLLPQMPANILEVIATGELPAMVLETDSLDDRVMLSVRETPPAQGEEVHVLSSVFDVQQRCESIPGKCGQDAVNEVLGKQGVVIAPAGDGLATVRFHNQGRTLKLPLNVLKAYDPPRKAGRVR